MRLIRNGTKLINADCIASCHLFENAITLGLTNGEFARMVYFKNKEYLESDFADLEVYLSDENLKDTFELKGD